MSECKHERPLEVVKLGRDKHSYRCKLCGILFAENRVVILTKTRHDQMTQVLEAAREFEKSSHHKDGCRPSKLGDCTCGKEALSNALKAYDERTGKE